MTVTGTPRAARRATSTDARLATRTHRTARKSAPDAASLELAGAVETLVDDAALAEAEADLASSESPAAAELESALRRANGAGTAL